MSHLQHLPPGVRRAANLPSAVLLSLLVVIGSPKLFAAGSAATATAVSVPSAPVSSGQVVTLTAMVTASGAPVTVGFVDFREGSVDLGTASLQSNGTASLKLQFPPGRFAITARFMGSNAGQPSVSRSEFLRQMGQSSTSLSATNGVLTATVTGSQPAAPRGVVTFFDLETHRRFGSAVLRGGTVSSGLQPGLAPPAVGTYADLFQYRNLLSGDFNGDGIPDYALLSYDSATGENMLDIFLGQANGTYTAVPPGATEYLRLYLAADFNNDGKTDLVASVSDPRSVSLLISNGDGTFTPQASVDGAGNAAGDFNGDGKVDLITNTGNAFSSLTLQFGDGTGNFNTQTTYFAGGLSGPVADYNNDGNLDLIGQSYSFDTGYAPYPSDYPGNGSGDFSTIAGIPIPSYPTGGIAGPVADFNGDGKEDFVAYDDSANLYIFLGDGTGNFIAPSAAAGTIIPTGALLGYSTLDVNGDGIPDIVAVLESSLNADGQPNPVPNVLVLIGKGDGTFTTYNGVSATPATYPLLGANNPNDLVSFSNVGGIASVPATGTATALLRAPRLGPGRHRIVALFDGDRFLPPSLSAPVWLTPWHR